MSSSQDVLLWTRIPRFRRTPTIHVRAILGTLHNDDSYFWQATDFVALRELMGARQDKSLWFCSTSLRASGKFLFGDPACDRIQFPPPDFETVVSAEQNMLRK